MKRNKLLIPIVLLIFCLVNSCTENSTNPTPPAEINDITSPPCQWINVLEINSSGDFFAATSDGLFHSTDNGSSWDLITIPFAGTEDINELKIASNDYIYVPSYSLNVTYLLRSTDNGNTWSEIRSALGWISSIEEDQYGNIYYCEHGLYKSTDEGDSWQQLYSEGVHDVFVPNDTMIIIGVPGTFSGHLIYSPNNGSTWQTTSYNVTVLEFYKYGSIIFVGGMFGVEGGGGVHKSADEGINWESCGLGRRSITSFVTNKLNQLFIGTDEGIYFINDEGTSWQNVLVDSVVTTLMHDSKNYLYAGTNNGTFMRSTDNGTTWHN